MSALRRDVLAGATVSLILIPQAMAYAQLAGLPPYYGLYAAFLPPVIAVLFGSCNQLHTGPVAMTSILTAAILGGLAAPGTTDYVHLALILAFLAGLLRVLLGLFRLGIIVNFLSQPVLTGFTNAAALIIAFSQLSKVFGVARAHEGWFLRDTWQIFAQIGHIHLPTLFMAGVAFSIITGLRRVKPALPGVLIAVMLTAILSWATGFENKMTVAPDRLLDRGSQQLLASLNARKHQTREYRQQIARKARQIKAVRMLNGAFDAHDLAVQYQIDVLTLKVHELEAQNNKAEFDLLQESFERETARDSTGAEVSFFRQSPDAKWSGGHRWHIVAMAEDSVTLSGGGAVIGEIPAGLPKFSLPEVEWSLLPQLLFGALLLVLIGFMEAISISKAIATKTRERFDVNQQLIGQGLANITSSFTSAYPVSGSFARSALTLNMGATTGISAITASIIVMLVLLFLTPWFYYIPQAVLAVIIIIGVANFINFKALRIAWLANRNDGITAVATFASALLFAPQIQKAIYLGAGLALVFYLARRTKPRVAILGRHADGILRDARVHNLPTCDYISVFRFDGSLDYPNVAFFEDTILEVVHNRPKVAFILVICDGINFIDASGVEMLRNVYLQLQDLRVQMVFSGMKKQISEALSRTGLDSMIHKKIIYRTANRALEAIFPQIDDPDFDPQRCPLRLQRRSGRRRETP